MIEAAGPGAMIVVRFRVRRAMIQVRFAALPS
jgi:hypothetical protein